jgi:hypothetical protein
MRPAALVSVVFVVVASAVASALAFSPDRSGTALFWALGGGPTLFLAILGAAWARREDYLVEWLRPRAGDISRGLVGGAALFGAAWSFARFVTPVGSRREIWLVSLYSQLGDPRSMRAHSTALYAGLALVAVAEELLWRGAVTQLLAERFGSRWAWAWSAVLYALAYVPTMWALRAGEGLNPVLVIAALGGGLLWGAMARLFGRLVPGMIAHVLFDWAVVIVFPLWGGS